MSLTKNIIILSEKSSGSSACQNLLAGIAEINLVLKTKHFRNETLYWTKAASILGMPQIKMVDSVVPYSREVAKAELISFLKDNLGDYPFPDDDKKMIMDGWKRLCQRYSPIFLEKSPHHLCQWPAIELIMEFMEREKDIDILLLGLVRNPMDTVYSQYARWRSNPASVEKQWRIAYSNLLKLKDRMGDKLIVIRYEDMVSKPDALDRVFDFCGVSASDADETFLHRESLSKWKNDRLFKFSLSQETVELARIFGYKEEEVANSYHPFWPIIRRVSRIRYKLQKRFNK